MNGNFQMKTIHTFGNNAIRRKDQNIAFNFHVCTLSGECREDFQIGGVQGRTQEFK